MKQLKRKLFDTVGWRIAWWISFLLGKTASFRVRGLEEFTEYLSTGRGAILIMWHGRTLLPIYYLRNKGFWAIISLSRDGEIQNRIVSRYGHRTIRGSSGRAGVRAFLESIKRIRQGGVLCVTPDGPKGPDRKVQMGTLQLAQRSGCPIVPLGVSARPRKLLGSWDSYMAPAPFCRAGLVFGDRLFIPADLTEEATSEWATRIEIALNDVEQQAEKLALGNV